MTRIAFVGQLLLASLALIGCRTGDQNLLESDDGVTVEGEGGVDEGSTDEGSVEREANWHDESHSKKVDPDYATVFPESELLRFEITIDEAQWSAMQADLDGNVSSGPGGMMPGGDPESEYKPMWGEGTIAFQGNTWQHVGIRYKGNSTLRAAADSGTDKFPFKLDFDEWEQTYPQIDDQRFYGFKQLNLSSSLDDASFMRERVASDLFRGFGVPAAHVSFCEVYLDRGAGMNFVGIYSLVEEVDDTVYESQFADASGNLYKPEGAGSTFAWGSFNEAELDLKTNEDQPDYSDALALYDALHAGSRTTDSSAWQAQLESTFYVDGFLRYLAVNQIIQNWDTYGIARHNYFLYNDGGLLTWVPWDNNESMKEGRQGGALSLGLQEVGEDWPILRFLMDVPAYEQTYQTYLAEFASEHFSEEKMSEVLAAHSAVIGEVATQEDSGFSRAVESLSEHVAARQSAVADYLSQ